ncbi:zinc finger MYM-type protein 1-like [Arctopsyche grandis]|uniref:zinc finger MYM-type protein 1-like n=2 Tax=Arctopsyche grandis TaxID=121162 RepID=UPI00406D826E
MDIENNNESGLVVEINNNCNCLIENVLKRRFASLPFNEKEIIVKSPKPTPILNIQSKTKTFKRYFNTETYEKISWICGCAHLTKLFCWPCILFSQEVNVWSKFGFSDLNNLSKSRKRHECSQAHICSAAQFKKFGKGPRIENFLSAQFKANIEMHNKEVTANRYILSKLISAICFLAKQEQPLRGHFEHQESENRGNYIELLYLLSESDIKLKTHLDNSTVFTGLSNHIQNDLVSAISKVLLDEIKTEIRASKFVSIIVDESTDISRKAQLSTIFRYVDENNEIQERFVGFVDVSPNRTANALFQHIRETLEEFGCLDKLIAQTYDGAAVMSGEHNGVQRKIRDICPNSLFVHCYAHRLNLVLSQSVKHISGCKRFFSRMLSFSTFFCKSSRRISLLDCQIKKRFPTAAPTRWNYNSKILNMILEYQTELMEIFNQIINDEDESDTDAVINAEVLHRYLKEFEFNFNLHLFSAIFNSADFLFEILQKKTFDISYCVSEIKKFVKYLDNKKDDFDSLWNKVITKNFNRKRKYAECEEDVKTTYKLHYSEILETLSVNTTNRFRDIENLKFLEFFNVKKFKEYENNFPDFLFKSLHLTYGKYFDFMKLKSELIYMYSTQDFHLKSINDVKELIVKDDLIDVLEQVFSLIQLICTIPSTSASAERSFSTMKRIKTFTRSSQSEERLSGLALIAIEKKIMSNLKNNKKFYDAVIDEFSLRLRCHESSRFLGSWFKSEIQESKRHVTLQNAELPAQKLSFVSSCLGAHSSRHTVVPVAQLNYRYLKSHTRSDMGYKVTPLKIEQNTFKTKLLHKSTYSSKLRGLTDA